MGKKRNRKRGGLASKVQRTLAISTKVEFVVGVGIVCFVFFLRDWVSGSYFCPFLRFGVFSLFHGFVM